MTDDVEGTLIVIPVERLVGWIDAGRHREVAHAACEDDEGT